MNQPHLKKNLRVLATGFVLMFLGATGGWWSAKHAAMPESMAMVDPIPAVSSGENKVLYWYDPMYPQRHFDKPGKSPFMDMELIPKSAGTSGESAGVKIDPAMMQSLGMRLTTATRVPLASQVESTGIIGYNERDVAVVQSRVGGFVQRVWPLAPGDLIEAGQPLVEVLAPDWTAAQREFLAVKSSGDGVLLAAARERMRLLGMSEEQVREVEHDGIPRTTFTVNAPIDGVVQSLDVRIGMTLMSGLTLARINGLATVWLEAAVPEHLAGEVHIGSDATIYLAGFSKQAVEGRVTAILPALNEATRSLRVRVELSNPDGRLRPGLSAQVTLRKSSSDLVLAVPTEAIIRTGKRSLLMVAGDHGRFMPVEVTLGREAGNWTTITAGLSEGQQVVLSGQFLIDSEASLNGIVARSAGEPAMFTPAALHEADAEVRSIDSSEITLAHDPFKTLPMPGMTMSFPFASPELAQGLKIGDKVRVGVRQTDAGLVVERIEKAGEGL